MRGFLIPWIPKYLFHYSAHKGHCGAENKWLYYGTAHQTLHMQSKSRALDISHKWVKWLPVLDLLCRAYMLVTLQQFWIETEPQLQTTEWVQKEEQKKADVIEETVWQEMSSSTSPMVFFSLSLVQLTDWGLSPSVGWWWNCVYMSILQSSVYKLWLKKHHWMYVCEIQPQQLTMQSIR